MALTLARHTHKNKWISVAALIWPVAQRYYSNIMSTVSHFCADSRHICRWPSNVRGKNSRSNKNFHLKVFSLVDIVIEDFEVEGF
jgi:hypothetical protein